MNLNQNIVKDKLTSVIIAAIQDKKGQDITVIDLSKIESSPAPTLIICQARSTSQVSAVADNVRDEVSKELKIKPYAVDGYRNSQWIIVDFGSVMVHIFLPEPREFYRLEDLWSDGEISEIPNID
ncbi:MAG: ribosome silencing factor [Bacteroides sp.]|nr:ribosome silencing factor [Bacteroides sp.]MBD5419253.1 ribosome silencing factor [Bacteroides sp.]